MSVCLQPLVSSMQCACAVLYCLWPDRLFSIFPHYLVKGTIVEKRIAEDRMCVFIFLKLFPKLLPF